MRLLVMPEKIELIKINENEFRIAENKIFLLEPNLLYVESIGDQTDETAKVYLDFYTNLIDKTYGKIDVVVDINNSKKSTTYARQNWKKMGELEKTGKVALFGLHPVAQVLAAFVIRFTNKKDFKFFKTKEEALAWIKK